MPARIDIQRATSRRSTEFPKNAQIRAWAEKALKGQKIDASLCIRIVDAPEIQSLNQNYRKKDYATNVLSFPMQIADEKGARYLGDILICAEVVNREALDQKKSRDAHWAHMVVHGVLHLLGYDHVQERDAQVMEELEIGILQILGYPDPYNPPL